MDLQGITQKDQQQNLCTFKKKEKSLREGPKPAEAAGYEDITHEAQLPRQRGQNDKPGETRGDPEPAAPARGRDRQRAGCSQQRGFPPSASSAGSASARRPRPRPRPRPGPALPGSPRGGGPAAGGGSWGLLRALLEQPMTGRGGRCRSLFPTARPGAPSGGAGGATVRHRATAPGEPQGWPWRWCLKTLLPASAAALLTPGRPVLCIPAPEVFSCARCGCLKGLRGSRREGDCRAA